jgi:hypothetical protein
MLILSPAKEQPPQHERLNVSRPEVSPKVSRAEGFAFEKLSLSTCVAALRFLC